jgi:hypothetical protein
LARGGVSHTSTILEPFPRLEKVTDGLFEGEEAVVHVIERIVARLGLRVPSHHLRWMRSSDASGPRVPLASL